MPRLTPLRKLAMPPDTWERHTIVAELVGPAATVLDVGGVAGELEMFMPGSSVTSLNVEGPADAHFDGDRFPFEDASFDAAVSLDVLEHIPREERQRHFTELRRVTRRTVVLCCPLGSPSHTQAERDVARWYRDTAGEPHRFLEEHIANGLPTTGEIQGMASAAGLEPELLFHGDFREANRLFKLSTEAKANRTPVAIGRYARARLGARRDAAHEERESEHTNRIFLRAELSP